MIYHSRNSRKKAEFNSENDHKKYVYKEYVYDKMKESLPQLRIIFLCFALLYGMFGYLDYLTIDEYFHQFLIIRFAIVIPLLVLFIAVSYHSIILHIGQHFLMLCLIVGGLGIAYMLIMYPNNFSYYGGLFMIIFSGYFLLKLNTGFALAGNVFIQLFYIGGYILINGSLTFDTFLVLAFFMGANIIGLTGSFQLESMGRLKYMQSKEIKRQNRQLEEQVLIQHNKLLQIEKAFESTSDAIAIFDPSGHLINYNDAFSKIMAIKVDTDPHQLDDIIVSVIKGLPWNGEKTIDSSDDSKITVLVQADSVYEHGKIIGAVATLKDITERKAAEEKIQYIGYHDHLTGLYNRYGFDVEASKVDCENQLPLSVIMVDLNGLKLINDTYGHALGDEFLQSASSILQEVCRKQDIIARWGGDEFIIFLPKTNYEQGTKIAKEINAASLLVKCQDIPISMALGVACKIHENEDVLTVMRLAEDKMYRQKLTDSHSAKSAILNALNKALHVKSYETETHTQNMQEAAKAMGIHLGLSSDELSRLDLITKLHDIGKINIPPEILSKKGPLTDEEWAVMKKHAEIGYRIAKATQEFSHVSNEILSHHERWDGSGYPQNLKGEEIPYLARIVTIVDSYEVMLNGRVYKKAMSEEDIINEFKRCAGNQFDPNLVAVFLEVIFDLKEINHKDQ